MWLIWIFLLLFLWHSWFLDTSLFWSRFWWGWKVILGLSFHQLKNMEQLSLCRYYALLYKHRHCTLESRGHINILFKQKIIFTLWFFSMQHLLNLSTLNIEIAYRICTNITATHFVKRRIFNERLLTFRWKGSTRLRNRSKDNTSDFTFSLELGVWLWLYCSPAENLTLHTN